MLKLTSSRLSGALALVAAAFAMNGVACSSSQPAKKSGAGAGEEEECETSTSTKKSTSKLTQTGTGSNSSTSTSSGTGSGTGTGTDDGPTYADGIKTLIDKSCAKSGCHNSGGTDPDLSTYAKIKAEKDDFFRTLDPNDDKAMPPGTPLKAADLNLLKEWEEADLPEGEAAEDTSEDTGSATSSKTSTSTSTKTSKCSSTSTSKKTTDEEEEEED